MLFKNKNARAVLATALAVITIIMLTFSVSADELVDCGGNDCYDLNGDGYCDFCTGDYIPPCSGSHTPASIEYERKPTCITDGYIGYLCADCNREYEVRVPATGVHTYTKGVCTGCGITLPDCGGNDCYDLDKDGYCDFCTGDYIPPCEGEHTIGWKEYEKLNTCTTDGYIGYVCAKCNRAYEVVTKAVGHGDTYWASIGNDSCFEYCGRCNVKIGHIDHYSSSDPATPCVKEYSATQIVSGHYCDRCKTYLDIQETKTTLQNVLIVTIDENYGTRQQFDYDAFMTYKYIYVENKRAEYVSSFTFEVRSAKNMSVRFDAILNYIINGNDAILIDIENEQIYSHEKKHRVETVTLTGYEQWVQHGSVYSLYSVKAFDKFWEKGTFPVDSVMTAEIDSSVHGGLVVSPKYTAVTPGASFLLGESARPFRVKAYPADLSTFLENLKKSPIKITLEYDEQTAKAEQCSHLQFFRTVKADHESAMNSNEYAQGYNDAIQSVINDNPVQGFFQGLWSAMVLFFTILGGGITLGGITLSSVFSTIALVIIVAFVVKLVR